MRQEDQAPRNSALMERMCSVAGAAEAHDPIGTGSSVSRLFLFEAPTPWTDALYVADPAGTVQQRMRAVQMDFVQRLRATNQFARLLGEGYPSYYGIAPDEEWSVPGMRRVLLGTRSEGAISAFEIAEYFFPADSDDLVSFARAFFEAPETLCQFEAYRNKAYTPMREFLVCTHGHVDICCARFGVPLYQQARAAFPLVRAWRTTHFGGHRFAPTAWEFPSGYKWAFLDRESASQVLCQDGDTAELSTKVRGWSGGPVKAQVLEREGLRRFGWDWQRFRRRLEVVSDGGEEGPWGVRMHYESPEGIRGVFHGVVAVRRKLPMLGCGPSWGGSHGDMIEYYLESLVES